MVKPICSTTTVPITIVPWKKSGIYPSDRGIYPRTIGIKLDLCICTIPTVGLYGKLGEITATHKSNISCRRPSSSYSIVPNWFPLPAARRRTPPPHAPPQSVAARRHRTPPPHAARRTPMPHANASHRHRTPRHPPSPPPPPLHMFAVNNIVTRRPPVRPPNGT